MIVDVVQRWNGGRASYRPAREVVDTRRLDVAELARDVARRFVEHHHYEHTFPAGRFRFGLFDRTALVGVCVFSQPARDEVTACVPGDRDERTELGRLVLLDEVGANAESWFVARCNDSLRRAGIVGYVSFSDPEPRTALDGRVVMPGHVGTVYQALGGVYLGRSRPDAIRLLPDGTNFPNRTVQKIRKQERGWWPAVERLVAWGASPPLRGEDPRAWLARELPRVTRKVPHGGKHKYAWTLHRRDRRHLPASKPYPKVVPSVVEVCA